MIMFHCTLFWEMQLLKMAGKVEHGKSKHEHFSSNSLGKTNNNRPSVHIRIHELWNRELGKFVAYTAACLACNCIARYVFFGWDWKIRNGEVEYDSLYAIEGYCFHLDHLLLYIFRWKCFYRIEFWYAGCFIFKHTAYARIVSCLLHTQVNSRICTKHSIPEMRKTKKTKDKAKEG